MIQYRFRGRFVSKQTAKKYARIKSKSPYLKVDVSLGRSRSIKKGVSERTISKARAEVRLLEKGRIAQIRKYISPVKRRKILRKDRETPFSEVYEEEEEEEEEYFREDIAPILTEFTRYPNRRLIYLVGMEMVFQRPAPKRYHGKLRVSTRYTDKYLNRSIFFSNFSFPLGSLAIDRFIKDAVYEMLKGARKGETQYYVIGEFKEVRARFFKTIAPRQKIPVQFRHVRH